MRIGIFGGSFDPPHIGHLVLAMECQQQLGLDTLLWMPTQSPPHKQDQPLAPIETRVALVQAAIRDNSCFQLSRLEIDRPGPQYAADTVQLVAQQYPGAEICYLIGGDSLNDLPDWYHPEVIVSLCACIGVMRRLGQKHDIQRLESRLPGITAKLRFVATPRLEISSTVIRERIENGQPYRYYVPESVYRLIEQNGFYRVS
jgi:nicotinate-nucleotide adenylyltransferase